MALATITQTLYATTTDATKTILANFTATEGDTIQVNMTVFGTNDSGNALSTLVDALYLFRNGVMSLVGFSKIQGITDSISKNWIVGAEIDDTNANQLNITVTGQNSQTIRWAVQGEWRAFAVNASP